jgi:hypothetical protein
VGPGLIDAAGQLGDGLVELALVLQHLCTSDARPEHLLTVACETGLAQCLVGHLPRLVEPPDKPQEHGLLVECAETAQLPELVETCSRREQVDALAQG